ncbi:MAG TPA: hypothetical protein VF469_28540 [Kofleriaceae bacterium]
MLSCKSTRAASARCSPTCRFVIAPPATGASDELDGSTSSIVVPERARPIGIDARSRSAALTWPDAPAELPSPHAISNDERGAP